MADIFVSYTRADQHIAGKIVRLLEAQGWSVWWDTRISGGERWDGVIEREITAASCVVVLWTPQSINREWVLLEAHHGKDRGILVPILVDIDKPPFAFGLIQARNLTGWDGATRMEVVRQFLEDVFYKTREADGKALAACFAELQALYALARVAIETKAVASLAEANDGIGRKMKEIERLEEEERNLRREQTGRLARILSRHGYPVPQ